jgi:hypothetical protein
MLYNNNKLKISTAFAQPLPFLPGNISTASLAGTISLGSPLSPSGSGLYLQGPSFHLLVHYPLGLISLHPCQGPIPGQFWNIFG